MAYVDWRIKGSEFINCNCAYGCPCQFNALPTHGDCHAYGAMRIDEGHFGDTTLDGLCYVMTLSWPGAIHEGNGTCQAIIDERADEKQREALVKIVHGEETEPGATHFQVFSTTMNTVHDPIFKPIELSVDLEERTASLAISEILNATVEPIRNPVTGDKHRARIDLPHGFEYAQCEVASGTTMATGKIKLDLSSTHSHVAMLHLTQNGVVR